MAKIQFVAACKGQIAMAEFVTALVKLAMVP